MYTGLQSLYNHVHVHVVSYIMHYIITSALEYQANCKNESIKFDEYEMAKRRYIYLLSHQQTLSHSSFLVLLLQRSCVRLSNSCPHAAHLFLAMRLLLGFSAHDIIPQTPVATELDQLTVFLGPARLRQ